MAEGKRVASSCQPLVSLITINYNQAQTTRQFLDSSRLLTYANYEIIVIDNASSPPLSGQIQLTNYPKARIIRSEVNLGFAGGNNLGIQAAAGAYFFIVNNDTELSPGLLQALLQPFAAYPEVGVVCPKIKYFDAPTLVQYAGYQRMNMLTGSAHIVGYGQRDEGQFDRPGPTNFAHGCAMMVSRRVVEHVGRFAERFFLYYEELDWSKRITNEGFIIYYQPSATVLHKESVSVGRQSTLKTYYMTRNRILYMRRHASWFQRLVFYGYFTGAVLPKHVAQFLFRGQLTHLGAFMRGVAWNLTSASASPV